MFSKKIRLGSRKQTVSVATALVLMAIEELQDDPLNKARVVYGYSIMSHLKEKYDWNVKSGTVYPILKKLKLDNLIVIQTSMQKKSNRQQIFYKINKQGKKLIAEIRSLNPEALEMALREGNPSDSQSLIKNITKIPNEDFTQKFLAPMLFQFEEKISKMISINESIEQMETLQKEIHKSIEQIESCKKNLESHIERIINYRQFHTK